MSTAEATVLDQVTNENSSETSNAETVQKVTRKRQSNEPTYLIDAEGINSQLHATFGGSLLAALDAAEKGETPEKVDLIFETTYKALPSSPEVTQYWVAFMGEGYPEAFTAYELLQPVGTEPDTSKLIEAINAFKSADISCLHFLPLIGPKINPAVPLLSQIRGNRNDKTPFVVYTKNIGRVYAHVDDGHFKFESLDGASLTPHQQNMFNKWFGEQLASFITPERLSDGFSRAAAEFLHRSTDVSDHLNQLKVIEVTGKQIIDSLGIEDASEGSSEG